MSKPPVRQFHVDYGNIVNVIRTPVHVSESFDPRKRDPKTVIHKRYWAIWDTGATNTVITSKVVKELNLVATGKTNATGVNTTSRVDTYLINLRLPNDVGIQSVRVAELPIQGGDVLIGMDIIRLGDFAISNVGKTQFAFSIPSTQNNLFGPNNTHSGKNKPNKFPNFSRNDRVKIKNTKTGKTKNIKWKRAKPLLENNSDWELTNE